MTRLAPSGSGDLQLVLFARACVAGARGGGVAAAWAPQLRRWRWPGAGRSGAPSPTPRVPLGRCRPAPWPPLPPARPRPGFSAVTRATAAAAAAAAAAARRPLKRRDCRGAIAGQSRLPGAEAARCPTRSCDPRASGGRARGWSELRPVARAGLKEARCRRRRCGPVEQALRSSLSCGPRPVRVLAGGAPPACLPRAPAHGAASPQLPWPGAGCEVLRRPRPASLSLRFPDRVRDASLPASASPHPGAGDPLSARPPTTLPRPADRELAALPGP